MKKPCVVILACGLFGMLGCHDSQQTEADHAVQAMRQSFDAAPEPLKTAFQALKSAIESSDFLKAKESLDKLQQLQSQMTPEQLSAVAEQRQTLLVKASAAVQNGDTNAMKVIQAARSQSRSR
jgi:hypothetical protein